MRLEGHALRLTILIGEDDVWHHKPLYHEIVHRAHAAGLAGATVLRGIEGYGASRSARSCRSWTSWSPRAWWWSIRSR